MKTHNIKVKSGNKIIAQKDVNEATARRVLVDIIHIVHGTTEKATIKAMESNLNKFKIRNPHNGHVIHINKI